jgi:hypothetical protein
LIPVDAELRAMRRAFWMRFGLYVLGVLVFLWIAWFVFLVAGFSVSRW